MSEQLTRQEHILMWELFAAGGEKLLKDIRPKPKSTPHHALAKKGLLKTSSKDRSILMVLEDKGWRWIVDTDPFPVGDDEKRVTAERRLLQILMRSIKRYADDNNERIQDLFRPARGPESRSDARDVSHTTEDIDKAVATAFFEIAGRPASGSVRLSKLRAKLKHIERSALDAALVVMWKSKRANLMNLDNPRDIEAEGDAALKTGIHTFHVVRVFE